MRIPTASENIRGQGEDRHKGDCVPDAGTRLDARAPAICAGAGWEHVPAWRVPQIALVLTGDEIAPAGLDLMNGAIWDVNTPMLSALVQSQGGHLFQVHRVKDTKQDLSVTLQSLSGNVDLIETSGGVSVGDRDHLKPVLRTLQAEILVSSVAIKPGKPVTISRLGTALVLSLTGNLVSAFVTWQVLGRPLLERLSGSYDDMVAAGGCENDGSFPGIFFHRY